jgi:hypothetical protein
MNHLSRPESEHPLTNTTCKDCGKIIWHTKYARPLRCPACKEEQNRIRTLARYHERTEAKRGEYRKQKKVYDSGTWKMKKQRWEPEAHTFSILCKCPVCQRKHTVEMTAKPIIMPRVYCSEHTYKRQMYNPWEGRI